METTVLVDIVINTVLGGLVVYLTFRQYKADKAAKEDAKKEKESDSQSELELKVKELEGKIAMQYGELSTKLSNLEKSIAEGKSTNYAFEMRILSNIDKLDSKLERMNDQLIRLIYNFKPTNENEK